MKHIRHIRQAQCKQAQYKKGVLLRPDFAKATSGKQGFGG